MTQIGEEADELLLRYKLDLLLRTGKLLMESGADTNRIERNMHRVASYLDIPEDKLHIDIRWTMLMVNVSDEKHSFSKFQKCEKHNINMTTITEVSKLSWRAIRQDYSLEQYEKELVEISKKPRNFSHYLVALGAGLACGGFCKLFGCDWIACLIASVCAFIGLRIRARCVEGGLNTYMAIGLAAFISTCLAYFSTFLDISSTPYHPLLACALFVVPGVPLINFVDDMIDNHLLVGITRAANTAMIIGSMTFGITFALRIFTTDDTGLEQTFRQLSIAANDPYWICAIAAAVAAMGFSMIFNIPRRLLWVVALGGIIAVCTRNFVNYELGYGPIIGSFTGSLLVNIICTRAVHWLHVPIHVIGIPSVIPMIPGVLMYRSMLGFVSMQGVVGEVTDSFMNGINSALIIMCISLGVAIPNIISRRSIVKVRKALLEKILRERSQRGKPTI